jgi:4-methyl-5(b-hydroxyethyl)-thiazole monophosphate biosynthesis
VSPFSLHNYKAGAALHCTPPMGFGQRLPDTSSAQHSFCVCCCRGPGTAFEFALALVQQLYGAEKMREVAGPMVMPPDYDQAL